MKNIFITGVNSGLGYALTEAYLKQGDRVCAVGREVPKTFENNPNFCFFPYDLSKTEELKETLGKFIKKRSFEIAILNAGVLGEIQTLQETDLDMIKSVMEINTWANKEIIDAFNEFAFVKQVVAISSGASVNGSKGWGAYSLSKAALNMLLKLYAKELPSTHFTTLAPGVIDTAMVRHIINQVDAETYPSAARLKEGPIQTTKEAAHRLIKTFPKLMEYESGSFLDVRKMDD
jgi:NAD(P)-dependent dehydrogenase (short-subunit alcohol dehydrogenase family)